VIIVEGRTNGDHGFVTLHSSSKDSVEITTLVGSFFQRNGPYYGTWMKTARSMHVVHLENVPEPSRGGLPA
jgi:hypothetical protein